jgi:hypothetical protein
MTKTHRALDVAVGGAVLGVDLVRFGRSVRLMGELWMTSDISRIFSLCRLAPVA